GTTTSQWVGVVGLDGHAIQVAVGTNHSCALLEGGAIQCWGANGSGQLGDGTTDKSSQPVTVVGLGEAKAVSAGAGITCAILASSGEMMCWGTNHAGRLGNGSTSSPGMSTTPLKVGGLEDVVHIDVGGAVACALNDSGQVYCWGHNERGAVGNGELQSTGTPALVPLVTTAVDVSTSPSTNYSTINSCAVLTGGSVWCWGDNFYDQLGPNATTGRSADPIEFVELPEASRVSTGVGHICAILSENSSVACWGQNQSGQLGNGSTQNS